MSGYLTADELQALAGVSHLACLNEIRALKAQIAKLEAVVISAKEYVGYLDSEPRITGGPRLGRLRAALAALEDDE